MALKIFTLFGIWIAPIICTAQVDSAAVSYLGKYSYSILVQTENGKFYDGTGFIFKRGDICYLVSNYHVIRHINNFTQEIKNRPQTLFLLVRDENNVQKTMAFNVNDSLFDKPIALPVHKQINLSMIPIGSKAPYNLHIINHLLDTSVFDLKPDNIFFFGYPIVSTKNPENISDLFEANIRFVSGKFEDSFNDWDSLSQKNFPSLEKEIEERLKIYRLHYFYCTALGEQGFSGSPIMGEYTIIQNGIPKKIYRLAGVVFAANNALSKTWCIKAKTLYNFLLLSTH